MSSGDADIEPIKRPADHHVAEADERLPECAFVVGMHMDMCIEMCSACYARLESSRRRIIIEYRHVHPRALDMLSGDADIEPI